MTISYELAPNPKWYIADLTGLPLGGGYLATYSNLNNTVIKVVYQDAGGLNAWPYIDIPNTGLKGILFDENGSQGPFYFAVDSTQPTDTYFLEVFDSNGVLQWTIHNFSPPGGGGGGGTTILAIDNLVANNVMYRNIGASANPIGVTSLMLAPGAHQGLAKTASNANPDIWFFKNNTSATDSLTFTNFATSGTSLNGDVTPVEYLNYTCGVAGAGETTKYVQFPITQNAYNLNNQAAKLTIWAKSSSSSTITLKWLQFFGDGVGATASVNSVIQAQPLTPSWQQISVTANIPILPSPLVYGGCGNSGLFLQVWYPTDATTNIDFTKPALYLGTVAPTSEYETYDQISTILDSPRTGDVQATLTNAWLSTSNACPFGWVFMNDGTIGSATSGATARANIDTFPLYNLIWNSVIRTWAPIVGATTGTAIGDFTANLPLYLTRALGRVFAGTLNTEVSQTFTYTAAINQTQLTVGSSASFLTGAPVNLTGGSLPTELTANITYYVINVNSTHIKLATTLVNAMAGTAITFNGTTGTSGSSAVNVTPYALGQTNGEDNHTLTIAEMPAHTHRVNGNFVNDSASNNVYQIGGSGDRSAATDPTGGDGPHNNVQPTTYMNVYIKL